MEQTNLPEELCEPQKVKDPKTGLEKLVYLCYQPIGKRINFYKNNTIHFWTDLTLIITVVVLLAGIVSLIGYNFFYKSNQVIINLNYNEEQLVNGGEVLFNVNFENKSGSKEVRDAKMTIKLPDGLHEVVNDFNGYETDGNDLIIGTLKPKAKNEIKISGLLLTNMGEEEKFLFVLSYTDNYGQPVQEFTTKTFNVSRSTVTATSTINDWLYTGAPIPTKVKVENLSKRSWDAKFGYEVSGAQYSQAAIADDFFKDLKAGESREIDSFLTVDHSAANKIQITDRLDVVYGDKQFTIYKQTREVGLSKPKISLQINTSRKSAQPGETILVSITFENNEEVELSNLKLSLNAIGDYVDKEKTTGDFANILNLENLQPGEKRSIDAQVATLGSVVISEEKYNKAVITLQPTLNYTVNFYPQTINVSSAPLNLPMSSALSLRSTGMFYTKAGDQIGVGSVPPRPDEYTAYWAILELGNQSNTVRNVRLTATIPTGVEYDEVFNITLGSPVRRDGNKIEWYVPEIAPYAGISTSTPAARIQLAIMPSAADVGKVLPLLTNITVTGIDGQTGAELSTSGRDITTAIFADQSLNKVSK